MGARLRVRDQTLVMVLNPLGLFLTRAQAMCQSQRLSKNLLRRGMLLSKSRLLHKSTLQSESLLLHKSMLLFKSPLPSKNTPRSKSRLLPKSTIRNKDLLPHRSPVIFRSRIMRQARVQAMTPIQTTPLTRIILITQDMPPALGQTQLLALAPVPVPVVPTFLMI